MLMQLRGTKFDAMKAAKRLVDDAAWQKLIDMDRTRDLLHLDARTLLFVLVGALELRDEKAIDRVVSFCLGGTVETILMLAAATRLLTWGHPEKAWDILSLVQDPANSRRYTALCHRVSMKAQDQTIREAARARFHALVGVGATDSDVEAEPARKSLVAANLAERQFPPTDGVAYTPGTLDIIEGGEIDPSHREANLLLERKFDLAIPKAREPLVYRFDDVFVNGLGQIWRRDGEIVFNGNRPIPVVAEGLDIPQYDRAVLCTNGTKGFFHWYAERLPSLAWRFVADDMDAPILFGDHAGAFQEQTIALLGDKAPAVARVADAAYCRTVYVGRNSLAGLSDWSRFGFIYDRLAENAAAHESRRFAKAIYISRRDTIRRVMVNEEELEARLSGMGVECLSFSDLSLADQINCARGARVIIGGHGAGLTHIIGAHPGLSVVEIMPSQPGSHSLRFNYARMSRVRGHKHTLWLEPINPVSRSWSVTMAPFCNLVQSVIEKAV